MNWINFLWIFYFAAHTTAGILYLILCMVFYGVEKAGPWAWAVPCVCLALLVLDLSGRFNLRGSMAKTLAALLLPLLCGCVELLVMDDDVAAAATETWWAWVCAQLALAVYVLLQGEKREPGLAKAEALLLQGSDMAVVEGVWLSTMAGVVLFMASFGLPVSLFIGGLIASRNTLLDYGGVKGMLAGLLISYIFQCLWYWKGVRMVGKNAPELAGEVPLFSLFIPVWNQVQVRKLARRLQLRDVKEYY